MPLRHPFRPALAAALATLALAAAPRAQQLTVPRASPHARVEQTVGLSVLAVDYHRPAVRGRTIWGELVPYGEVWRAGANENTTFETSTAIEVEGRVLPPGRYGLHVIPTTGTWMVALSTMADAWGSYSYDPAEDALRAPAAPRPAPMAEQLAFRFDDVTDSTATLVLHWEQVELPVRIAVNTPEVVLNSMARELRGTSGFTWETWDQAAAFALTERIRLEEALRFGDRSLEQRPTFQASMTRAAVLDAMGRGRDAAEARRVALEMDATEPELNRTGRRMLAARMPAYAVSAFERAVRDHPDSWAAHAGFGEALEAAGDRARAAEHYAHARERAPEDRRAPLDAALARLRGPAPTR